MTDEEVNEAETDDDQDEEDEDPLQDFEPVVTEVHANYERMKDLQAVLLEQVEAIKTLPTPEDQVIALSQIVASSVAEMVGTVMSLLHDVATSAIDSDMYVRQWMVDAEPLIFGGQDDDEDDEDDDEDEDAADAADDSRLSPEDGENIGGVLDELQAAMELSAEAIPDDSPAKEGLTSILARTKAARVRVTEVTGDKTADVIPLPSKEEPAPEPEAAESPEEAAPPEETTPTEEATP
jgi:hypothetical protein